MQKKFKKDEEDVSAYYPDGDSEHMERDDFEEEFLAENTRKKAKAKRKKARLTGSQITLIAVIFVVYTAVIFAAAWLIFYKPAHGNNNNVPFETDTNETDNEKPPLDNPDDVSDNNNAVIKDGYVPKDGVYNILVIGHDKEALLADVTMIVNVNSEDNSVTVMQLPRDTYVSTDNVITHKLNNEFNTFYASAYQSGEKDPYKSAMVSYEELLEKSLCINITHTVLMGLDGFRGIVDAIDGVDVYVPEAMQYSDPEQDLYIDIPAGQQHLDGYNAEAFVRFRSGYVQADLGRINAQKIFLTAVFNKVKATVKSANVTAITNMANEIFKCVTTDMSVSDIIYYAKFMMGVDLSSITMTTIPGNMDDPYYIVNRTETLKLVNEHFNVYSKEISDSIFDKSFLFCDVSDKQMCEIYYDTTGTTFDKSHTGDEIDGESIYIPRT